jgi:hypothetical protein
MNPIIAGAAIGAGSNIISDFFGKKSQDKANAFNKEAAKNAITWRVEDAKRAGVNPLAALGASVSSPTARAYDYSGTRSAGQGIGNAVANKQINELEIESRRLQNNLTKAQTDQVNEQIASSRNARLGSSANSSQDEEALELILGGKKFSTSPNWSDTEVLEERYGDVAGAGYGLAVALADAYHNMTKHEKELVRKGLKRDTRRGRRSTNIKHSQSSNTRYTNRNQSGRAPRMGRRRY